MARAIWSGSINFGLVSIPVGLNSATEDHTIHFQQFQRGTADRIRYQRVNERTGKEVDYADIVRGRDVGDGEYVIVEPEELDAIAPGRSRDRHGGRAARAHGDVGSAGGVAAQRLLDS